MLQFYTTDRGKPTYTGKRDTLSYPFKKASPQLLAMFLTELTLVNRNIKNQNQVNE